MSNYEFLELDVADGIATITLNRPPVNVMHIPMMAELNAVLETMLADADLAAIVLRADGKAFCAGVDVSDHTAEKVGEMIRQFHGIFRKLAATDALTIAVVSRAALGGGCELALACDLRIASENAVFGLPEVKLGVIPGYGGTQRLPRLVGPGFALEMVMTGRMVKADEALAMGLVNRVVPADELEAVVQKLAETILANGPLAVRAGKEAVQEGLQEPLGGGLEIEARLFGGLTGTEDQAEGMDAFLEKRKAEFKGR